jgi:hypothetical protein
MEWLDSCVYVQRKRAPMDFQFLMKGNPCVATGCVSSLYLAISYKCHFSVIPLSSIWPSYPGSVTLIQNIGFFFFQSLECLYTHNEVSWGKDPRLATKSIYASCTPDGNFRQYF